LKIAQHINLSTLGFEKKKKCILGFWGIIRLDLMREALSHFMNPIS